jgi:hypothetical protein
MTMVGADVEALERLQGSLISAAEQFDSSQKRIDSLLASTPWDGPDADRFTGEWGSALRAHLVSATDALHQAADHVGRQRDEQVSASTEAGPGGGAAGTVGGAVGSAAAAGAVATAAAAAAESLGIGGSGFSDNPSGDPYVESTDLVTARGDLSLGLDGGLGHGFKVEHLSDGTIRVTEIDEVTGGASTGFGLEATGSWGSDTVHVGAAAELSGAATLSAGTSWIVKDAGEAQKLIGNRLLALQPGLTTGAHAASRVATFFTPKEYEDDLGETALKDMATFHLPKRDGGFVTLAAEGSGSASAGLGVGSDVSASLSQALGYERDRYGNRTFVFAQGMEGDLNMDALSFGPPSAGNVSGQAALSQSVTVDKHGRPTSITVVGEAGTGDTLHRRTTTIDLTDPALKSSAAGIVNGLTNPSTLDDATRDLIRSATSATSTIDEKLTTSSGSYGGALDLEFIGKAGGGVHVDVQSLEVDKRTVSGTGQRP